jgi:hypothetical protein
MSAYPTKEITIRPSAREILKDRWSDRSPAPGEPSCVCSWCGRQIGVSRDAPEWQDHIEWCAGCEICEQPVRLFEPNERGSRELRFHTKCFNEIIEPSA